MVLMSFQSCSQFVLSRSGFLPNSRHYVKAFSIFSLSSSFIGSPNPYFSYSRFSIFCLAYCSSLVRSWLSCLIGFLMIVPLLMGTLVGREWVEERLRFEPVDELFGHWERRFSLFISILIIIMTF